MSNTPPPPPPPSGENPPQPPPPPSVLGINDDSLARRHDTQDTRTYPCDACGGELMFDIEAQQLKCQHCGTSHEITAENAGATVNENDLSEALGLIRAGKLRHTQSFLEDEKEVVCQNCGGHTTFSGSLTADKCPYCLTPIQRDDVHAAPERLPVDGVVPFAIADKEAKEIIGKWINSRWFAPNEFKQYSTTGEFTSLYGAYFTYDAETSTRYTGQRGDTYTVTVGSGDNRRTETRVKWRPARGTVRNSFDDVTVFANEGMEKNRVAKLEPWPTHDAKPYSAQYVAGHLCRTYDHDVEECMSEATSEMTAEIRSTVRRDIGGDQQKIHNMDITWRNMTYKHLLMPIWLLTVMYLGKPYQVYINGVTGEVQGERPYSKVKIAIAVGAALALIILILILSRLR